jgi:hypothetical protein
LRNRSINDGCDPFAIVPALRGDIPANPTDARDSRLRLTLLLLFLHICLCVLVCLRLLRLICLRRLRIRPLILDLDLVVLVLVRRRRRVIILRLLLHLPVILRRRCILRANCTSCAEKKDCCEDCEVPFHGHLPAIRCREKLNSQSRIAGLMPKGSIRYRCCKLCNFSYLREDWICGISGCAGRAVVQIALGWWFSASEQ